MGSLTLYVDAFWANCWDCGPYVALREKGLLFSTGIGLLQEGTGVSAGVRMQALTGLAPALQHGPFWVAESSAIIEYLEDAFPPPHWPRLFPAEPTARARARQLMSWIRTELGELRAERDTRLLFYPRGERPPLGPAAARQAARLIEVVERLAPAPGGGVAGDWCIADVDVAFTLMRLVRAGDPVPPALRAYAEATWCRPSVCEYVEHPRPPHPPAVLAR